MSTETRQQTYYGPQDDTRHPETPDTPEMSHTPEPVGRTTAVEHAVPDTRPERDEQPETFPGHDEPAAAAPALPGSGAPGSGTSAITLWDEAQAREFRGRWREAQLRFVDDPKAAADEARSLVSEVVETLTGALVEQRRRLDDQDGPADDARGDETERMRVAMRRYRDFFDRVLGL